MLGVIINTVTVLLGSAVGLLLKKGIPERFNQAVMTAIALCTLCIGVTGTLKGENTLVMILSMVCGTIVGTLLELDGFLGGIGQRIEARLKHRGGGAGITEGFVTASLLFCIGAMTLVGALEAGLNGDHRMLITKSMLDLVSSCMLSVSLGFGVMLSAGFVFVFQGALVLLAQLLAPVLTASAIAEITCVGSLMILAIGTNLLGVTKIKVADMLPALLFAPVFVWLFSLLPFAI